MAQTWCSSPNSPGFPRGLFGADLGSSWPPAARTILRTFCELAARGASLSARQMPIDSLSSDSALIVKQTWIGLGNLGGDRTNGSRLSNRLSISNNSFDIGMICSSCRMGEVVFKVHPRAGSGNDPVLILGVTAGRSGPAVFWGVNLDRHCLSPSGQVVAHLFDVSA